MSENYALDYATDSDKGMVRTNNEDSGYAGPHLLAIADGMGGHAAGEVASQLMIEHLSKLDRADLPEEDLEQELQAAAAAGNHAIAQRVREVPENDGMGTTLTAILNNSQQLFLIHVGDSRAYRLRDGELEQLTEDDTFVQMLVNEGKLAPEDVHAHPQRSLILKAYTGRPVEPTLMQLSPRLGDRLLLCSDGLSDPLTQETIAETLAGGTAKEAATKLVELAIKAGGPDNVTVIVADIVPAHSEHPTAPELAGAPNLQAAPARPTTAASRAMAAGVTATRKPVTIEPAPNPIAETPAEELEEKKTAGKSTKKGLWLGIISVLVVVLVLTIGAVLGYQKTQKNFYLTTTNEQIQIEQGANLKILGASLHHHYQNVCLSDSGDLSLYGASEAAPIACSPLTTNDFTAVGKQKLANLPAGSYNDVWEQLQSLKSYVLPVCLTTETGVRAEPGVTCREER